MCSYATWHTTANKLSGFAGHKLFLFHTICLNRCPSFVLYYAWTIRWGICIAMHLHLNWLCCFISYLVIAFCLCITSITSWLRHWNWNVVELLLVLERMMFVCESLRWLTEHIAVFRSCQHLVSNIWGCFSLQPSSNPSSFLCAFVLALFCSPQPDHLFSLGSVLL